MDIHEYQAKEILSKFGVGVPPGALAYSPEQAAYRARELGGDTWVIKAQVHAGGRGKAGTTPTARGELSHSIRVREIRRASASPRTCKASRAD